MTGGAGFIGSHAAHRFEAEGWNVRVFDDLSTGSRENCSDSWDLVVGDVRDASAVTAAVRGANAVVHLAAFISVPESFERFDDCYRTNVRGTFHVLEACREHGVDKLAFASSSAVYAAEPDQARSENDCPDPISPYAVSKLEGEHLLEAFREQHGLRSVALRFFNVYGARQAADSAYAAAVPIFSERGLRGEALTIYGDGHQTRDFVYVADVAGSIFRAATGAENGIYNVGTGQPVSVLALADTIKSLTGSEAPHDFAPPRLGDVRSSTADIRAIADSLGWTPDHSLESGLRETLVWYRERIGREGP